MTNLRAPSQNTARKRRQRERQRKDGLHRIEIVLTDLEFNALEYIREHRNPQREPYDRNELISLMLLCDLKRLKDKETKLGACQHCGDSLPKGCNGLFKGDSACWFTRDSRSLNLTRVTGHANIEETD